MRIFISIIWIFAVAAIAVLASIPQFLVLEGSQDKMLHVTAFCFLMIGPAAALLRPGHVFGCALGLFLVGIGMEIVQQLVPGRQSSFEDIYSNAAGILLGMLIGYCFRSEYLHARAAMRKGGNPG